MRNIDTFRSLYTIPQIVENQLNFSEGSLEHPIYHPERCLLKHIDIVVGRALETNIAELHFAALLHDITKSGYCPPLWAGRYGTLRKLKEGNYWRNDEHQNQAVDFILIPEVKKWMLDNLVDIWMVADICKNHMEVKEHLYGRWSVNRIVSNHVSKYFQSESKNVLRSIDKVGDKNIRNEYVFWDLAYYFSSYCDNMLL